MDSSEPDHRLGIEQLRSEFYKANIEHTKNAYRSLYSTMSDEHAQINAERLIRTSFIMAVADVQRVHAHLAVVAVPAAIVTAGLAAWEVVARNNSAGDMIPSLPCAMAALVTVAAALGMLSERGETQRCAGVNSAVSDSDASHIREQAGKNLERRLKRRGYKPQPKRQALGPA